jgi:hypothetical protein
MQLGRTSSDSPVKTSVPGCAMMMYLAGTPVYTIIPVGRWLSDAFLQYIEKHIKEFTVGVSEKMLLCNTFYNIPLGPWISTDTANSRSAAQFYRPSRNIFGSNGSLRSHFRPQSLQTPTTWQIFYWLWIFTWNSVLLNYNLNRGCYAKWAKK